MKGLRRSKPAPAEDPLGSLEEEIRQLRKELQTLNNHRFIRVQNSSRRMLTFQLMRGLALGLGTVIGASVLVSILAYVLAQIDFIPIIGEWAKDFASQIEAEMGTRQTPVEAEANPDGSIAPEGKDSDAEPATDSAN